MIIKKGVKQKKEKQKKKKKIQKMKLFRINFPKTEYQIIYQLILLMIK